MVVARPRPGDTLTHDVYLGTRLLAGRPAVARGLPRGLDPGPRSGAATGYDEANDRLIVYGGETPSGAADTDVYVLVNASARAARPRGSATRRPAGRGRSRTRRFGYDPVSNRLVVSGGCHGSCATPSAETWVLANANGLGGTPAWIRLDASGPEARFGAAAAFDPAGNRLFVHGGAAERPGRRSPTPGCSRAPTGSGLQRGARSRRPARCRWRAASRA